MNANCLSCLATVPYVNGVRPKFCSHCSKPMNVGLSTSKIGTTIQPSQSREEEIYEHEEDESGEPREFKTSARNLKISAKIEGQSGRKALTLGELASMPEHYFNNGPRPVYKGDPNRIVEDTLRLGAQEIGE